MPTYEYKCRKCGNQFEIMQNITDKPLSECPKCSGTLERLISGGGGMLLKGNRFHKNKSIGDSCCSRGEICDNPKRCCERDN